MNSDQIIKMRNKGDQNFITAEAEKIISAAKRRKKHGEGDSKPHDRKRSHR